MIHMHVLIPFIATLPIPTGQGQECFHLFIIYGPALTSSKYWLNEQTQPKRMFMAVYFVLTYHLLLELYL